MIARELNKNIIIYLYVFRQGSKRKTVLCPYGYCSMSQRFDPRRASPRRCFFLLKRERKMHCSLFGKKNLSEPRYKLSYRDMESKRQNYTKMIDDESIMYRVFKLWGRPWTTFSSRPHRSTTVPFRVVFHYLHFCFHFPWL